jgi:hypothetical protein
MTTRRRPRGNQITECAGAAVTFALYCWKSAARKGVNMPLLQKDETLMAWAEVRATPEHVYALVSDVTRIPEWSPETLRVEWLTPDRFRAWNRRRLGRWTTVAKVVQAEPARRFSFLVEARGGDWAEWTFAIEPGSTTGTTRVTEIFRMCVPLPLSMVFFELFLLFITDRRKDLQSNLELSVDRIRAIAEAESDA